MFHPVGDRFGQDEISQQQFIVYGSQERVLREHQRRSTQHGHACTGACISQGVQVGYQTAAQADGLLDCVIPKGYPSRQSARFPGVYLCRGERIMGRSIPSCSQRTYNSR